MLCSAERVNDNGTPYICEGEHMKDQDTIERTNIKECYVAIAGNSNLRSKNEEVNDANHKEDDSDPRTAYILGSDGSQTQKLTEYLLKTGVDTNTDTENLITNGNKSAQQVNNSQPNINLNISGINEHLLRRSTRYRKPKVIFDL